MPGDANFGLRCYDEYLRLVDPRKLGKAPRRSTKKLAGMRHATWRHLKSGLEHIDIEWRATAWIFQRATHLNLPTLDPCHDGSSYTLPGYPDLAGTVAVDVVVDIAVDNRVDSAVDTSLR